MHHLLVDMPVDDSSLQQLQQISDLKVTVIPFSEEERPLATSQVQDIDILFCQSPPANFSDCSKLKWIQIGSVGFNQLIPLQLPDLGIRATNAQGVFDVPIAEWNLAMMFQLARDMQGMYHNQTMARWDRSARFQTEIRGSTIGLWGYGGIGRETARLAKAYGMNVNVLVRGEIKTRDLSYVVPHTGDSLGVLPDQVFTIGQEEQFLRDLDFLIVCVPLNRQTEGMIGEAQLKMLPPRAFILNPSRGPIIQEHALLRALEERWIAGAALDTHYHYPMPVDHPLWKMPHVIMTPHISGSSLSTHYKSRVWDIFLGNVHRYLNHQPLLNELSPMQLRGN
jgi:phosphoglycerate dehydrogenase-like enzyme